MLSGTNDTQRKQGDFFKFFNEHDKRRNTNFLKTFRNAKFLETV